MLQNTSTINGAMLLQLPWLPEIENMKRLLTIHIARNFQRKSFLEILEKMISNNTFSNILCGTLIKIAFFQKIYLGYLCEYLFLKTDYFPTLLYNSSLGQIY